MKNIYIAVISMFATFANAQSGVISGYIGCLTAEHLDQLGMAIAKGDTKLRDSMMGKVCVVIQDYEYSLLDRGILKSKVRVYVGDNTIDLFVHSEAVK